MGVVRPPRAKKDAALKGGATEDYGIGLFGLGSAWAQFYTLEH